MIRGDVTRIEGLYPYPNAASSKASPLLPADRLIAYLRAHYARRGCFAARIDRG
jgi:hypothetical protein